MSSVYGMLFGPFETFAFMRVALVTCVALALANGPVGTLLLLRRMGLSGDVLSHAVMPGAALGFLYGGYSMAALSFGGVLTAALVAVCATAVGHLRPKRQDASLAAFYLVSLALGVMIVAIRGSYADLMHVLFGTVLAIDVRALWFIAGVSSLTVLVIAAIYRPLAVASFDPAFLKQVGGRGDVFGGLFLAGVVLNLVTSFQAFGTLLAIGPMLLPAAAALCWTQNVLLTMGLSIALGLAADYAGLLMSYYENLPSGPAIVFMGGIIYGASLVLAGPLRLRSHRHEEQAHEGAGG